MLAYSEISTFRWWLWGSSTVDSGYEAPSAEQRTSVVECGDSMDTLLYAETSLAKGVEVGTSVWRNSEGWYRVARQFAHSSCSTMRSRTAEDTSEVVFEWWLQIRWCQRADPEVGQSSSQMDKLAWWGVQWSNSHGDWPCGWRQRRLEPAQRQGQEPERQRR